jgi:hypothetical protein
MTDPTALDLSTLDLTSVLDTLTPTVYESLKRAVELGKWPNGERLNKTQRELCLQEVIYYDGKHKPEQERVGHIQRDDHEHCASDGDKQHDHAGNRWDDEQVLVFRDMLAQQPTKH